MTVIRRPNTIHLGHKSTLGTSVRVHAQTWAETLAKPARKPNRYEGKVSRACQSGKHRSRCHNCHCVCPCHASGH